MIERKTPVAIIGLGSIGKTLIRELTTSRHYEVVAVVGRDAEKTQRTLDELGVSNITIAEPDTVSDYAELILDAAPAHAFRSFAEPVILAGKQLIVISVGALLENWDLIELAQTTGATIHVPSGAIAGLDGVLAAAQGTIHSSKIVTKKPLAGLGVTSPAGTDENPLATQLFSGTVREAFKLFPANVNVAVALSLAGLGPDRTLIEVWADPDLTRNTHHIVVESDAGTLSITVESLPSENPKTAKFAALSILAWLDKQRATLKIGT